ncbi:MULTISPECIES: hypothetical protein [Mycolicibacter]|uniref:Uncharacterized protein n=2 Tax=Mycolicibacter TaxID=1073531 RepID=A0ABU5XME5_9MYCO|nr:MULTISPECIES: hypothetical protein [unclassified Mycolicibacter]MEB3023445.1 hypothetical protein [Mycolicibacter sp. MYC098]MEB3033788.1 hypothetical protein [Mycolicibacter sp. MYC340]
MGKEAGGGMLVTHPERHDRGIVVGSAGPSWTPDELTTAPPADGMVKARWPDSADPTEVSEYRSSEEIS